MWLGTKDLRFGDSAPTLVSATDLSYRVRCWAGISGSMACAVGCIKTAAAGPACGSCRPEADSSPPQSLDGPAGRDEASRADDHERLLTASPERAMGETPHDVAAESREAAPAPRIGRAERLLLCVAMIVLTGAACAAVLLRRWEIGVPDEWVWPYFRYAPQWGWALPAAVVAGLLVWAVCFIASRAPLRPAEEAVAVALVFLLALVLLYVMPLPAPELPHKAEALTVFHGAGGYYAESLFVKDVPGYLRAYPKFIKRLTVKGPLGHISDHPPGAALFHVLLNRVAALSPALQRSVLPSDRAALGEWLPHLRRWLLDVGAGRWIATRPKGRSGPALSAIPKPPDLTDAALAGLFLSSHVFRFLAAATVVIVYFLGKRLGGVRVGVLGAAFCALIPSLHGFSPFVDQLFCPLAALIMLLTLIALDRKSFLLAALAGFMLFVGLQFTLAFLVIAAVGGLAGALHWWGAARSGKGEYGLKDAGILAGGAVIGMLIPLTLMELAFGYDSVEVWRTCLVKHASFSGRFGRTYWPWFLIGPVEFLVFMGVPISCLVLWAMARDLPSFRRRGRPMTLLWSVAGVLAFLVVSGRNRGEVARLWIILMPFGATVAAWAVARLGGEKRALVVVALVALFAQALVFRMSLETLKI